MKEIELIDQFCTYLTNLHFEFKRELRKGSYHSQGYVDIVIKLGENPLQFTAIEAKVDNFRQVIQQAIYNSLYFTHSFILIPKNPSEKVLKICKEIGIGIISLKDKEFQISLKTKFQNKYMHISNDKIIRNWFQNRCGRVLSKREIPEDYNSENLPTPTFDWVKNKEICPFCKNKKGFGIVKLTPEVTWCISCQEKWNPLVPIILPKKEILIKPEPKKIQYKKLDAFLN